MADPADTAAAAVLTAELAFDARVTAVVDQLSAAAQGLHHCPADGRTRRYATRATVSVDAAGNVDLFIWPRGSDGTIGLLSARVPHNGVPFVVAQQLAEQFVEDEILKGLCPASEGKASD
jgi:hypothetical protein